MRGPTSIVSDRPGAALVDGDNALGHLVMKRAAELAIEKARQCGIGWVGTRRSNHAGQHSSTRGCPRRTI